MQTETFQEFAALNKGFVDPKEFIINLLLASVISFVLSFSYKRFGSSPSDKEGFSKNFFLLSTTTMLIITVVKSSLALSLGLVGALSIVRFRSAIKEPEELTFLFLSMTVGLGLGANQRETTIMGVGFILFVYVLRYVLRGGRASTSYHLVVSIPEDKESLGVDRIIEVIKPHCSLLQLKRLDSTRDQLEAAFTIDIADYAKLSQLGKLIHSINPKSKYTFMDVRGIVN